ncbi:MAG: HD domain-containing protein [Balneolaceae bacterium]
MPEIIQKAEKIVNAAFADKTDKAGEPYTGHLFRVRETVKANGGDHEQQCNALLHDLLEDCPDWNEEKLSELFSSRIVQGVKSLTKSEHQSYSDYLAKVSENPDAVIVKLADLQDNMNLSRLVNPQKSDFQRIEKYQKAHRQLISLNN